MAGEAPKTPLPEDFWTVETARIVAFPVAEGRRYGESWFRTVAGEKPAEKKSLRDQGLELEVGGFLNGQLVLESRPGRFQFHYRPSLGETVDIPTLGTIQDVWEPFHEKTSSFVHSSEFPPVRRVGFGSVCLKLVKDKEEAHGYLSGLLPDVGIRWEGCEDFLFQINRPRSITTDRGELRINRLCKWRVLLLRRISVTTDLTEGGTSVARPSPHLVLRLELDINSDQNNTSAFASDRAAAIIETCMEMAQEIAQSGDVP